MDGATASGTQLLRGSVGRGRRALSQLWQVPTFLFGLIAFILVAASAPYRDDLFHRSFTHELRGLREGFNDPAACDSLVAGAERLLEQLDKHPRHAGELHFLAGSAYYRQAEADAANHAARTQAIEHLEQALAASVPSADEAALCYRLGVMLYRTQTDLPRAIELIATGAEHSANLRPAAYRLLVDAHLALTPPDLDGALSAGKKLLEASTDPEAVGAARLLRGQLLVRKKQQLEALKELDRIGASVSPKLRVEARLLQTEVCKTQNLWRRAAAIWKDLLPDAAEVPGAKGRIYYELGHCYAGVEPPEPGPALAAWKEALALGGDAGQAAALRLGELKLQDAPGAAREALEFWQRALLTVQQPADYHNPYLDIDRARALLDEGCRVFLERRDYVHMEQTAELYKKLAAPGVAEQRLAEAAEAQGQAIAKAAPANDTARAEQARGHFRRAGLAFQSAAAAFPGPQRAEPYWRSAQCFLAAKDPVRAAEALELYVTLESNETRLAHAFYALAEAHTAQGRRDQARQAFYKCMEFPSTPYAYRARYQLAVEEMDKKNYEHARTILKQNLAAATPTMDRDAHEKSLYKMAGLLVHLKSYDEAAWHLKEATRQYPNHPHVLYARDLLADCYVKLAGVAKAKLSELEKGRPASASPESQADLAKLKDNHRRNRNSWLDQALQVHQNLVEELERRARQKPLEADEEVVLRRAAFGIADARFELNEFAEALRLYQILQKRYSGQVESLMACQRVWMCASVITQPSDLARTAREAAKEAVKIALADLPRMDVEAFRRGGGSSKDEWQSWLRWVHGQLNNTAAPVRLNPLAN